MSFGSVFSSVFHAIGNFFSHLSTNKTWQQQATATLTTLGGTVEGIIEITGSEDNAAEIKKAVDIVNHDFAVLVGLVNSYNPAAPKTFVAQLQVASNLIAQNMGNILALIAVKNVNTINQVKGVTTIVNAALQGVLAMVPAAPAAA